MASSSTKTPSITVCKEKNTGCHRFNGKANGLEWFDQIFNDCNFRPSADAKAKTAYECIESTRTCKELSFFDHSDDGNDFLAWVKCLQIGEQLFGASGETPAKTYICDDQSTNCAVWTNRNDSLIDFLRCYVDCQVHKEEGYTETSNMYVCVSPGSQCYHGTYFSQPDDDKRFDTLKQCYMDCENAMDYPEVASDEDDEEVLPKADWPTTVQ